MLILKLRNESYDLILLYKPVGADVVVGDAEIQDLVDFENLFMLGIQTQEQRDRFIAGALTALCIDTTHGTNQYSFQLLHLVVLSDEFGKGYPAGHFLCNRIDEKVEHFFFKALKQSCPRLVIHCIT